jgi:hypothetical protein
LFIGLGGTGAEIVGRVKNRVDMLSADIPRPDLQFVSYLGLDTRPMGKQPQTVQSCFQQDTTGKAPASFCYLGGFNGFDYIRGRVLQRATRDPDLARWWDQRLELSDKQIDEGAGRIRPIGRLCLYHRYLDVVRLVSTKLDALFSLREQQQARIAPDLAEMAPNVVIVCGSAGGTGSGMFLDVSYMAYHLARGIFQVPPRVTAVIVLPGLYAKRGAGTNLELAEAFQANAGALFEEIEFFLQNPSQMDERRLDRESPAFEITPGAWVPFHYCYLTSEALAGGALFEELDDLYSYVARALFQLYLTPEQTDDEAQMENLHKVRRDPIPGVGRAPAYSCFGFSSIEHPTHMLLGYVEARYALSLLQAGLGRPEQTLEDQIRREAASGARVWLNQLAQKTYGVLVERLNSIRDGMIEKLPSSVLDSAGKLPPSDRLPGQLQAAVAGAEQVVASAIRELSETYNSAAPGVLEQVRRMIDALVDAAPNGFFAVNELLKAADDILTEAVRQYRRQQAELGATSRKARNTLDANGDASGSLQSVLSRANRRTALEFVRTLQNYASNAIAEENLRLVAQLLDQICGPPTSVPGMPPEVLSVEVGGEPAILDRARDHVRGILGILESEATRYQELVGLKRFGIELGDPHVTQYLPELTADDPAPWAALDKQCGKLLGESKQLRAEMEELAKVWRQTPGMVLPHDPDRLEAFCGSFRRAVRQRTMALFTECLSASVESLLAECRDRSRRLRLLRSHAAPSCTVKTESLPARYAEPGRLWSLGSPTDIRRDLQEPGEAWATPTDLGPRQISVLHSWHGFPSIAVAQLLSPRAIYRRSLQPATGEPAGPPRFFLHNWADWNRPEGPPLQGGVSDALSLLDPQSIELFAIGRAIDTAAADEENRKKLQQVVYVDPVLIELGQPLSGEQLGGFIFQKLEEEGRRRYYRYYFKRYRAVNLRGKSQFQPSTEVALSTDLTEAMVRFSEVSDAVDRESLWSLRDAVKDALSEEGYRAMCAAYQENLKTRLEAASADERGAITAMYRALAESLERVPKPGV